MKTARARRIHTALFALHLEAPYKLPTLSLRVRFQPVFSCSCFLFLFLSRDFPRVTSMHQNCAFPELPACIRTVLSQRFRHIRLIPEGNLPVHLPTRESEALLEKGFIPRREGTEISRFSQ